MRLVSAERRWPTIYTPRAYHLFDHPDLPIEVYRGVVFPDASSPTIGADPAARAAAIERVDVFLRKQFE